MSFLPQILWHLKEKQTHSNLSITWLYILSPPKFLVDLVSLVNALSNILRPSGAKKYKIHRRQPLNAIYLAAPRIFCCVLCVLKQGCDGNTQLISHLWMGRLCRRVICFWTVALWRAQGCAEHPWVHPCQAVPLVLRCASRILARGGFIKTIFPNLTCNTGLFPCGMGNSELLMLPASPASGVWWWWSGSHRDSSGLGGLGVSLLFQTGGGA